METLSSHALGQLQHSLGVDQFGPVPVLFENPPPALDRMVFTVVWWVIQQLNRFADVVGQVHHPFEKLGAPAITFRPVGGLEQGHAVAALGHLLLPPNEEVAYCIQWYEVPRKAS